MAPISTLNYTLAMSTSAAQASVINQIGLISLDLVPFYVLIAVFLVLMIFCSIGVSTTTREKKLPRTLRLPTLVAEKNMRPPSSLPSRLVTLRELLGSRLRAVASVISDKSSVFFISRLKGWFVTVSRSFNYIMGRNQAKTAPRTLLLPSILGQSGLSSLLPSSSPPRALSGSSFVILTGPKTHQPWCYGRYDPRERTSYASLVSNFCTDVQSDFFFGHQISGNFWGTENMV